MWVQSWEDPWRRDGDPLQYSCLENPMDRGVLRAAVHGVAESGTTEVTEIHVHESVPFQIIFISRLLQGIGYSSLCYPVGPYCLSVPFFR